MSGRYPVNSKEYLKTTPVIPTSASDQTKKWMLRMNSVKQQLRPDFDWKKERFAFERKAEFEALKSVEIGALNVKEMKSITFSKDRIHRIHCDELSSADFARLFEKVGAPCIISGIPVSMNGPARTSWASWEAFNQKIPNCYDRYFGIYQPDDADYVDVSFVLLLTAYEVLIFVYRLN